MKEDLDKIFDTLLPILKDYSPPFSVDKPSKALKGKRNYTLVSSKKVIIAGRERSEVYFAGIIKQKDYVGFYYMLAYSEPKIKEQLSPDFLKLLRGKSCFYIRRIDKVLLADIKKALDIALDYYKHKGWV